MASLFDMSSPKALGPLVIAALVGAVGGYFLASANSTNNSERLTQQPILAEHNQSKQQTIARPHQTVINSSKSTATETTVKQDNDLTPEGVFYNVVNDDLEMAIASLQLLPELISNKDFKGIAKFKQTLLSLAKGDNEILDQLLLSFQQQIDNEDIKYELLQILTKIKHPKVENYAQELALSNDRNDKLTGLELLADLGVANQETMNIALDSLHDSTADPQILQTAMRAMPDMLISSEQNREILTRLEELSQHPEESVRSESLFSIAKQAKNEEQLTPLLNAMQSGSIDEKISAAMAIEKSTVRGDNLKYALLNEVKNMNGLPEVRAMAASSLKRFSLSSSELRVLESYRSSLSWNAG
jgi:hypothetical protein